MKTRALTSVLSWSARVGRHRSQKAYQKHLIHQDGLQEQPRPLPVLHTQLERSCSCELAPLSAIHPLLFRRIVGPKFTSISTSFLSRIKFIKPCRDYYNVDGIAPYNGTTASGVPCAVCADDGAPVDMLSTLPCLNIPGPNSANAP